VAAIRSGQLGLKTAIVECSDLGGVCLNWGCIPSKSLIHNAEVLSVFRNAADYGINIDNLTFDFGKAIDRSRDVVGRLTSGIGFLLKKNKVEYIQGTGVLEARDLIRVEEAGRTISAKNVIVATGATSLEIPSLPIDGEIVITSREAIIRKNLPDRAVIVGGGATGVEFAYIYNSYGVDVTIVEFQSRLVPLEDEEISRELEKSLSKQGVKVMTGSKVENAQTHGKEAELTVSGGVGEIKIVCDIVLVAVGARGNVDGIGLEGIGVSTNRNFIEIDDRMMTNVEGVYAIGDVTGKMLLAHVASAQGVTAVETIAGLDPPKLNYDLMPRATYCHPQVASFGLTESQAREAGYEVRIGRFPFSASGKAMASNETEGMIKLVLDAEIGDILGAHMIGSNVTELLGELSLARMLESTDKELGWLVHPHPTISEIVKEAALASLGEAIHA
jgi:dihydrolipoamide dehydrogenase